MIDFKNKNIIVTGGSGGIGFAITSAFLEAGGNVCIIARNKKKIARAEEELKKAKGAVYSLSCDVGNARHRQKIVAFIKTVFRGKVDILVNAAGIYGPKGRLEENGMSLWEKTLTVNVIGTVRMCHTVIPFMRKRKSGRIITFSGGGEGAFPYFTAYSASKGAIVRFTESLASEFENDNITVNAIAPGAVNTGLLQEVLVAGPEKVGATFYKRSYEQKETGGVPPEKAAALVLFLASDKARYISGKLLSAVYDRWWEFHLHKKYIASSDIYNFRRIKPKDRGYDW